MRGVHEWYEIELSVMSAFLAVADERSFTKAAKRLGVTQSALSHAIRGLEDQVGVRLLARTTRSVAPTEAGEQLLDELRPALTGIRGALHRIGGLRDTPRGRVRLLVPRLAAMSVLGPKLAEFARTYPDVVLDVSTDERGSTWSRAASMPGCSTESSFKTTWWQFASRPITGPRLSAHRRISRIIRSRRLPHDLLQHRCVNYRHGSGEIYRWELDKGDQFVVVAVNGPLITNDIGLLTRAAIDGVGLAFMSEEQAAPHLANGALVRVLEDWCPPFPGFFLYYPSRRQHPAALTALIETLRV